MSILTQKTITKEVSFQGIGIHSGIKANLKILPASPNTGIVFKRTDLHANNLIYPNYYNVVDTTLCTTISNEYNIKVSTIEHLMGALYCLGIDNATIELDGPEVPIMDGSSRPFVFLIQSAGISEQNHPKKFIKITKDIEVKQNDKWAKIEPFDGFKVAFTIDFDHPSFPKETQTSTIDFSTISYLSQVSRARTFGFAKDIENLRKNNLALGGSVNNAIVIDDYKIINEDGLRYKDEFVKHKILDAIGDLYLLGHSLIGSFSAFKSGHHLNNLLLRELVNNESAWEQVIIEDEDKAPILFTHITESI